MASGVVRIAVDVYVKETTSVSTREVAKAMQKARAEILGYVNDSVLVSDETTNGGKISKVGAEVHIHTEGCDTCVSQGRRPALQHV